MRGNVIFHLWGNISIYGEILIFRRLLFIFFIIVYCLFGQNIVRGEKLLFIGDNLLCPSSPTKEKRKQEKFIYIFFLYYVRFDYNIVMFLQKFTINCCFMILAKKTVIYL